MFRRLNVLMVAFWGYSFVLYGAAGSVSAPVGAEMESLTVMTSFGSLGLNPENQSSPRGRTIERKVPGSRARFMDAMIASWQAKSNGETKSPHRIDKLAPVGGIPVSLPHVPLPCGEKLYNGLEWYGYFTTLYEQQKHTRKNGDGRCLLMIEYPKLPDIEAQKAFLGGLYLFAMDGMSSLVLAYSKGSEIVELPIDILEVYEVVYG